MEEDSSLCHSQLDFLSGGFLIRFFRKFQQLYFSLFFQLMACAGVVMWYTVDRDEQWKKHLQFVLFGNLRRLYANLYVKS